MASLPSLESKVLRSDFTSNFVSWVNTPFGYPPLSPLARRVWRHFAGILPEGICRDGFSFSCPIAFFSLPPAVAFGLR